MTYNLLTENNKTKLFTEYGSVSQNVLFGNAVLAALMSGTEYDGITQNGDCSRESSVRTLVFRNKMQRRYRTQYGKDPPSDNAIRRWLKQFQETGGVLRRKGAGRQRTSQEEVDRIGKRFLDVHKNQLD
jgi:hypothetical protein